MKNMGNYMDIRKLMCTFAAPALKLKAFGV